ncbi:MULTISPECIES: S8 family serine peptidase [Streptomyces]|uniref:S8 family peptidase n=1 Tax=Streptomyces TaxID=1883 RepID=UPI00240E4BB9|nr:MULTISPECIES: S8 family serine peptidase [Streptomyces]WFB88535.1 S8 family serine peptidase [Streptomyces olivaceus]WGK50676.1 S8 family serine peptidase [Streptomyces sp. B146]
MRPILSAFAAALTTTLVATVGAVPAMAAQSPTGTDTGPGGRGRTANASWVTLITGDQVAVDADGNPLGVKRGEGRDNMPVRINRHGDHVFVVPEDAFGLIAEDRVDRRLFDVTLLTEDRQRETARRNGLGVILTYQDQAQAARSAVGAVGAAEVTRTFQALNGQAVTARPDDTGALWKALTDERAGSAHARLVPGVRKVWLNGLRHALLDTSVAQIGAPTAWASGYDGEGVKVAVLDTGVDSGHADLPKGTKVVAERNFTPSADARDHFGHGTHVASTVAGTGARSGGRYKGVAPGARIISGKVLGDDGSGDDAGIIAGMEWAVAEGARIVNLSLGGTDTPGTDPLEEAVDRLSRDTGALFVIAAGNDGPGDSTLGSPGTADEALTVGVVDSEEQIAPFSSRGPRPVDAAVKPDVTAPGVDITAAAAEDSLFDLDPGIPHPAPGYLTISGTSMATPHVAGAAAILLQRHPGWTGRQLKAALVASTADGGLGSYLQGSGRVDVAAALEQRVVAEPVSLTFGTASFPHQDDAAQERTVTYRNLGDTPVDLELSVSGTGPDGSAAPEGMFTLDRRHVALPAGGTATTTMTADTTLGGDLYGAYSAELVATGGGQRVRTAGAVVREAEVYDLTLRHLDREGREAAVFSTVLSDLDRGQYTLITNDSGATTFRLPRGSYSLDTLITALNGDATAVVAADLVIRPLLELTEDTTVAFDARDAEPVTFDVPDRRAERSDLSTAYTLDVGMRHMFALGSGGLRDFRVAQIGPRPAGGRMQSGVAAVYEHGSDVYNVAYGRTGPLYAGYHKTVRRGDLARIDTTAGVSVESREGVLFTTPTVNDALVAPEPVKGGLPFTKRVHVNTDHVTWSQDFLQVGDDDMVAETLYSMESRPFAARHVYRTVYNVGVFGPRLDAFSNLYRSGNAVYGTLGLFDDGAGHDGYSQHGVGTTEITRNGKRLQSTDYSVADGLQFIAPADKARYTISTRVRRDTVASVSTEVSATWSFDSARTDGEQALPLSVIRFSPALSEHSTSKARASVAVPVTVQGAAAGRNLASLRVYRSTDSGKHWQRTTVRDGVVRVKNPSAGGTVSFKAEARDRRGNTVVQTVLNAYRTA